MKTEPTITFDIFMAGDISQARQVCREYCFAIGLCVTVTPTDFIYTGGEEAGFRIGLVNYPRFPTVASELQRVAHDLAANLLTRLCQHSYLIIGQEETQWVSQKPIAF